MNIGIIGTGGVGGYFGGMLAKSGNQVTFIARNAHLASIQQNGLQVKSTKGNFTVDQAKATSDITELKNADLILIATKAWQVKEIAQQLKPIIQENTTILPLQNGVKAFDELKQFLPEKNLINGLCRIFSKIEAPGVINHMGVEPTIVFGENDRRTTERCQTIHQLFNDAAINNFVSNDVTTDVWKKFLMICSSGLLAVTRTNYGEIRSITETREMLEQLFTEIYQVALALQVNLKPNIVEKTMAAIDTFPAKATSSLTRDVWEGVPSEIEYQNGTIVALGKKYGIATPINHFVYNSILPSELKARQETSR